MTRFASRGMTASTFVSRLPREMCAAPGLLPRLTSCRSRQSSSVIGSPLAFISCTCFGVTSLICAFACAIMSAPLFIRYRRRSLVNQGRSDVLREAAFVRVELRHRSERNCNMVRHVSDWKVHDGWNSHVLGELTQHLLEPALGIAGVVGNVVEVPEREAGETIDRSTQAQERQHAIDAIHVLGD